MKRLLLFILLCGALSALNMGQAHAQRISVKTNAMGYLTLSPNFAVDVAMSRRLSIEFDASYNGWFGIDGVEEPGQSVNYLQKRHMTLATNVKYWFSRPFNGHAFGASINGGSYNMDLFGLRFHGDALTFGPVYTYAHVLTPRLNVEMTIAGGYGLRNRVDATDAPATREWGAMIHKVGVSLVYVLK